MIGLESSVHTSYCESIINFTKQKYAKGSPLNGKNNSRCKPPNRRARTETTVDSNSAFSHRFVVHRTLNASSEALGIKLYDKDGQCSELVGFCDLPLEVSPTTETALKWR